MILVGTHPVKVYFSAILYYTFAPESDAWCIAVLKFIIMKKILFVIAAFAAALVSCNKETESVIPAPDTTIGGAEIAIALTDDAADTRAFFDTTAKAEA